MRRNIIAGIAVFGLLLAGCGSDDSDGGDDTDSTETEVTTSSEAETSEPETTEPDDDATTSEDPDEGSAPDDSDEPQEPSTAGELTEDGASLQVGDTAVVEYVTSDKTFTLEVTVAELQESSFDDLAAAGLEVDDTDGLVPYFIRYDVTLVAGEEPSGVGVNAELNAITADNQRGGTLITIGYDGCRSDSFSSDSVVGDSLESCKVALVPESATVASVRWSGELDDGIIWEI